MVDAILGQRLEKAVWDGQQSCGRSEALLGQWGDLLSVGKPGTRTRSGVWREATPPAWTTSEMLDGQGYEHPSQEMWEVWSLKRILKCLSHLTYYYWVFFAIYVF